MEAGQYRVRIIKPLAWLDDEHRIQVCSFNPDIGKAGRFFVNKGAGGSVSVAPSSVEVLEKVRPEESTPPAP